MWDKYRRFMTIFFLICLIAMPFMVIATFLDWAWFLVVYALLLIGGLVYRAVKFKCPYCGYPLSRIAKSRENCCPVCGMDIPETEADIDWSYFTEDEE